ncbi:MAG: hypothetical protein KGJ32_05530 [Xanthomonadaceae bacterium]|nr:hypothetical protein [Xanthomonadaceae bacterium]
MEAVRRRIIRIALVLLALVGFSVRAGDGLGNTAIIRGKPDGHIPGWAIVARAPKGWTVDCCIYAEAIGVNAVLYRGEWTGKPQRVMVLNVWPRKLPTLAAEVQADRKHYRQADPAAKVTAIVVHDPAMRCAATAYRGTDHVDDAVVFCDPGRSSGIRLSWSVSFDDGDPMQPALLDDFKRVVAASRYMREVASPTATPPARGK